ncbi:MAG: RluA family pseudouridine synthase [Candidatus Omnitrophota bacterium]|nr:MAG: RluA family pseudouridine synthase [Candidatus Omnitrophota bacterium]
MHKELSVGHNENGERLDRILAVHITSFSRSKLHDLIENGNVLVNGQVKKPSFHLKTGDRILIKIEKPKEEPALYECQIPIIYEDNDIIVVDKPSGLVVHPPHPGYVETLVNALTFMKKELSTVDISRRGVVHRLDKETSGVMILAKNNESHNNLVTQFKERKVKKEYQAICWGQVKKESIRLDLPLKRDEKKRLRMKVSFVGAKRALTEIIPLKKFEDSTLLSIRLYTGRMHQIRVHLNFLGYPIVGDKKYGKKDKYEELFLHSHCLGLHHPRSKKPLEFVSPIPERFKKFVESKNQLYNK